MSTITAKEVVELASIVGKQLRKVGFTCATAESCTGGLVGHLITEIPGSSDYFLGSITTYSNDSKIRELGVSEETLKSFGAVSEQTARDMALGVKKVFGSDCAIATTGIAGPGGATKTKPVGLCYLSAIYKDKTFVKEFHFGTGRRINKERGAMAALESLRRLLLDIL